MNSEGFKKYLKKRGKADHVVEELVKQAASVSSQLETRCGKPAERVSVRELKGFIEGLSSDKKAPIKKFCRAIALYYRFIGMDDHADIAAAARAEKIEKSRRGFPLRNFVGIEPGHARELEKSGIRTTEHLLCRGCTREGRRMLTRETGVPARVITELVKMSDLARLGGLKAIRARLYYDAGVDTIEKLSSWEPEPLRKMLEDFVKRTGFKGVAPLPKEVRSTVAHARKLPRILEI